MAVSSVEIATIKLRLSHCRHAVKKIRIDRGHGLSMKQA